ncbi:hypothetical protein A3J61_02000 [Candidatus Nomurabacteria bacterium RIFCSPHIGHO2_02_FULL_38_15]|uniref:HTH arsR-type domain-containing protein n=1 Tax=Candidatus Nomurabacteria bacterium RIFCSPHIGHO2_02_FULL_38_15 TaxID=1801752 RepID=A0A1F6VRE5_9BACT|nr:MAG: hypothetical protein A3J61_02000 [Candidatus Nomurabacteria bacterium RIFCSPHIGHO2_02_FULL_38_15]
MQESLGKIFGSPYRARVIRFFVLNEAISHKTASIAKMLKIKKALLQRELNILSSIGFVNKKLSKGRTSGYQINLEFKNLEPLKDLVLHQDFIKKEEYPRKFRTAGKLKLLIISGTLTDNDKSRADLLVVADRVKRTAFESALRSIEAEIGKELVYVLLDTNEFKYRMEMRDKLLADILDFDHEELYKSAELSTMRLRIN